MEWFFFNKKENVMDVYMYSLFGKSGGRGLHWEISLEIHTTKMKILVGIIYEREREREREKKKKKKKKRKKKKSEKILSTK